MIDTAFEDARLAALYDQMCVGREDTDFYVDLAARLGATSVVDVAFEFRNPAARAWIDWNAASSRRTYMHPTDGPVDAWVDTLDVSGGLVTFERTYVFTRTGRTLRSTSTLRFPALSAVEASLRSAGFAAESLYGDWDRSPFTPSSPEMTFVATHSGR